MADIYDANSVKNTGQAAPIAAAPAVQPEVLTAEAEDRQEIQETGAMVDTVLRRSGEVKRKELFGAYTVRPGKRFLDEQKDEEVVLMLRAHPITNIRWVLMTLGMLVLPGVLDLAGLLSGFPANFVWVGKLTWYLITMGFAFEKFLDWFYSVFIVTNERCVDVDFINLLYRVVEYANLNHIEEPSMVMGGFVQSWFRYGDVNVATAAEDPGLQGLAVPYPDKVINIISELSEELEKRRERGA